MLRNTILTATLIFVLVFTANAQRGYASYNYFSAGMKSGIDIFNYKIDPNQQAELTSQLNLGFSGSFAYYYSWLFEFHGDFMISSRSFELKWNYPIDPQGLAPAFSVHRVPYVSFPMQARINALYFDRFKLNIGAGIMPEFRLRPKEVITYQNGAEEQSYQSRLSNNFNAILFAFPFSANLKIYLSKNYALEASANYLLYMNKLNSVYLSEPSPALSYRLGLFYEW